MTATPDPDRLMAFAAELAESGGRIAREGLGVSVEERKADGTEVTEADRAVERHLRASLSEHFPEDEILGEEEGGHAGPAAGRRWVLDPIDGTRSFASGVPLFGVLIGLEIAGRPWLGCCHFPMTGETVVAARGAGAWWNGRRAAVSACGDLSEARLLTSGLEYWRDWGTPGTRAGFERLVGRTRFTRTWGDCYGFMMIATGRAEVMVDPIAGGGPWDVIPLAPILAEAGARATTLDGGEVRYDTPAVATNGLLHDAVLDCLGASP